MALHRTNVEARIISSPTPAPVEQSIVMQTVKGALTQMGGHVGQSLGEVVVRDHPEHPGQPHRSRGGKVEVGLHHESPMAFLAL